MSCLTSSLTGKSRADEMRSQAQRILEESEALRAQAEAEFEIQLAARRDEAMRQEAERLAAAQAATLKLVNEAERRALSAEQRAAEASAQAARTSREIAELTRQKDNITTHLTQVRQLIGGQFGIELTELDQAPGSAEANEPPDGPGRGTAGEPRPDGRGKHANRVGDFWTK
jgi:hypothetical protein